MYRILFVAKLIFFLSLLPVEANYTTGTNDDGADTSNLIDENGGKARSYRQRQIQKVRDIARELDRARARLEKRKRDHKRRNQKDRKKLAASERKYQGKDRAVVAALDLMDAADRRYIRIKNSNAAALPFFEDPKAEDEAFKRKIETKKIFRGAASEESVAYQERKRVRKEVKKNAVERKWVELQLERRIRSLNSSLEYWASQGIKP